MNDLNLVSVRYDSGSDSTLSVLAIPEEKEFLCYVLEDEHREVKIAGETRIPAGRYEILLRTAGSIHPKYADRFPDMHEGMLWLQDVPNFKWIYIHLGNNDDHSAGCLLTGTDPTPDTKEGGGTLRDSTSAYIKVYKRVLNAMREGRRVYITIRDWA